MREHFDLRIINVYEVAVYNVIGKESAKVKAE